MNYQSKKSIVIFGAGDLAIEVAMLIRQLNYHGAGWNIVGFVVEDKNLFGSHICGYPIISGAATLQRNNYKGAASIGIGDPKISFNIKKQIDSLGLNIYFPTLIHPSAVADYKYLSLEEGVLLGAGSILTTKIRLGAFNYANVGCSIGHEVKTGSFCRINPQVHVSGGVVLEDFVYLGTGSLIMQYKNIGQGAQISMGSVISMNVEPWTVMAGNPARVIKKNDPWLIS